MIRARITEGAFLTNSYLWENDGALSIIDVGAKNTSVLSKIEAEKLPLKCTILTHNHLDHICGLSPALFEKPIFMHEYDLNNLTSEYIDYMYNAFGASLFKNEKDFREFKDFLLANKKNITPVIDGDVVENLRVMLTSGHTKGSISLVSDSEKLIFTGDTMFYSGYGRTDLQSGCEKEIMASLKKLYTLVTSGYEIYPGH